MNPNPTAVNSVACFLCGWEGADHELLAGPGAPLCPDCGSEQIMADY